MQFKGLVITLLVSSASAQGLKGFNYGATLSNGACRDGAGFKGLFQRANSLQGTSGFASARLYTTIQCGTANDPTSAIQAAIDTGTSLLLGMWASAGSDAFNNEIAALTRAIQQYPNLADRVIGISVGSEDLYRSSAQGVVNQAGIGANAAAVTDYIGRVRRAIVGTSLAGKPVGHVDTWTAWILPENGVVAQAVDFLGHNSFPYFETTRSNGIAQATDNFNSALGATESIARGKPVWVTETGWPHTGPTSGQAIASNQNAETYWKTVGCSLFGSRNTWWYTLEDANTAQTEIQFGVVALGGATPIYDLSCSNGAASSSSSSAAPPPPLTPLPVSSSISSPLSASSPSPPTLLLSSSQDSVSSLSSVSPESPESTSPASGGQTSGSSVQNSATATVPGQIFSILPTDSITPISSTDSVSATGSGAAETTSTTVAGGNNVPAESSTSAVSQAPTETKTGSSSVQSAAAGKVMEAVDGKLGMLLMAALGMFALF